MEIKKIIKIFKIKNRFKKYIINIKKLKKGACIM